MVQGTNVWFDPIRTSAQLVPRYNVWFDLIRSNPIKSGPIRRSTRLALITHTLCIPGLQIFDCDTVSPCPSLEENSGDPRDRSYLITLLWMTFPFSDTVNLSVTNLWFILSTHIELYEPDHSRFIVSRVRLVWDSKASLDRTYRPEERGRSDAIFEISLSTIVLFLFTIYTPSRILWYYWRSYYVSWKQSILLVV